MALKWPSMCWCAVKKLLTHSLTHSLTDMLMYCAQTTESIIMRSSPDCSPAILDFPYQYELDSLMIPLIDGVRWYTVLGKSFLCVWRENTSTEIPLLTHMTFNDLHGGAMHMLMLFQVSGGLSAIAELPVWSPRARHSVTVWYVALLKCYFLHTYCYDVVCHMGDNRERCCSDAATSDVVFPEKYYVENFREICRKIPVNFPWHCKIYLTHNRHQSTKAVCLAASCITNLRLFSCTGVA